MSNSSISQKSLRRLPALMLIISLALNGLLIGYIAGRHSVDKSAKPQIPHIVSFRKKQQTTKRLLKALPKERREMVLRRAIKRLKVKQPDYTPPNKIISRLRAQKRKAKLLMRQDKINVAEIAKAQADIRALEAKLAKNSDLLLLFLLEELDPQERKKLIGGAKDHLKRNKN